jgi:hypothetical protein
MEIFMYSEFVKEVEISELDDSQKNRDLLKNIKIVKETLDNMYNNLQYADGDLIDYFTYQIKAEESKYDYLIKQAKEKKIKII